MVNHPIHVKRSIYRGADQQKRRKAAEYNRIAVELETYINQQLEEQKSPFHRYDYHEIAAATGYSENVIRELCFSIDCGHNGFTAIRVGLSFEEATRLAERGEKI